MALIRWRKAETLRTTPGSDRLRHERVQLHDWPAYRSVDSGRVVTGGSNKLYSKYIVMDVVGRSRSMQHEWGLISVTVNSEDFDPFVYGYSIQPLLSC